MNSARFKAIAGTALAGAGVLMLANSVLAAEAKEAKPKVEVVFVLDSTGSMGGLIDGAKQKIWSIANTIISRKPTPQVRIGLITYRDKGDEYVTKQFDLTDDIDTVYKNLQTFKAGGGGDGPESVNQALDEAVHKMTWSKDKGVYKVIFLVGDYPPHMDYQDDVKYAKTCEAAVRQDLIINTVQCGNVAETTAAWQEISRLAEGTYVALAQSGNMQAVATPFDKDIAKVSDELGRTVVAYGSRERQAAVAGKLAMAAEAAAPAAADRAEYNLKSAGRAVQGAGDLVSDLKEKSVKLDAVRDEELPAEMQKLSKEEREKYVAGKQKERDTLNAKLSDLTKQRAAFIEQETKRLATAGKGDSFDQKVTEIINTQADKKQ
jgi:hypothetical protein